MNPIFDKDKILERERAAALFGEMAFEAAGKLIKEFGWDPGDPRRAILHGLIGGIMAEINGGQFGDGLTTAMINKILIDQLVKNKLVDGAELRWISGLLGVALDDGEGGAIADSATRNNANLSYYSEQDKRRLYNAFRYFEEDDGNATPEEIDAFLEAEMKRLTRSPEVLLIADGNISLPGGKILPPALAQHISVGGTVIYDPKTETFIPGPSLGAGVKLSSPVTGYVGYLYLPAEFADYSNEERQSKLVELFAGAGGSASLVSGIGMIGVQTEQGNLYGFAGGFDASFSISNMLNLYDRARGILNMTDEEFENKYGAGGVK